MRLDHDHFSDTQNTFEHGIGDHMSNEDITRVGDSPSKRTATVSRHEIRGLSTTSSAEQECGELGTEPGRGSAATKSTSKGENNTVFSSDEFHAPSSHFSCARGGSLRSPRQSKFQRKSSSMVKRLAELTVNKLQFNKLDRLYGRERESHQLQAAWEEIRQVQRSSRAGAPVLSEQDRKELDHSPGTRRLVTITGAAGTGKTALAESLRRTVQRDGGIYLQGKFPQQLQLDRPSSEPYAAFAAAFGDFCELVASLSTTHEAHSGMAERSSCAFKFTVTEFQERIRSEVGPDSSLLSRVIPGLQHVLVTGSASDSSQLSAESFGLQESHHQFKGAFRRFLRVISSLAPLALVLDDLQWADVGSLELLETLVLDRVNSFLVIGCFRSDEDVDSMPHVKAIERMTNAASLGGGLVHDAITIGNLDSLQVHDLLVDLLSSDRDDCAGLAECVRKKTLGNIFFMIQFLKMLQDSELLVYNFGALKWTWDLEAIEMKTAATENVVSLMKWKMMSLPASIERYLPMMACLGSTFLFSLFEIVVKHSSSVESDSSSEGDPGFDSLQLIAHFEKEGLVQSYGDDERELYRWVHDNIQEAALSLISEGGLKALRLHLGEILFRNLGSEALETHLFVVANLLQTECDDESALPRRLPIQMANLFFRAGAKAIENSAFAQAEGYLSTGIELLPSDKWQSHYDLSLHLYSTAAEAAFCNGSFEAMRSYCYEVLHQDDRPILDKRRVYNVLIDSLFAERPLCESLALCRGVLSKLGCYFPNHLVLLHVVWGLVRVKGSVKVSNMRERVAQLPDMSDDKTMWTMVLLDKFTTCAYFCKSNLVPLAILKGVQMTMERGVSRVSPAMFALFGFSLAAFAHDYKGGLAFAEEAIELLKRVKSSRKVESRVLFTTHALVFHNLRPASLSVKPLLRAYDVGMTMGDTESAAWSICFYFEFSILTGSPLEALKSDFAFYAEQLRDVNQLKILAVVLNMWQLVLLLTGDNSFDGTLSGDIVQQDQSIQEAAQDANSVHASIHKFVMYFASLLGLHEVVYQSIRKTDMDKGTYDALFPGTFSNCQLYAFNGLSMISLYRESKAKKYMKLGKRFAAKIKRWAGVGNPNVTHYDYLLDAELKSLLGDDDAAARLFELAVLYAGRRGLTQDRALAHERYGEHLSRLGPQRSQDADFHYEEAVQLYQEWGAHAKVKTLLQRSGTVMDLPSEIEIALS